MAGKSYLRCLGQPVLLSPAGEPVRFRTKKHLALLVYLAVEPPRHHRRDRLAELLWPNVGTAEGRHSLATALSVIRPRVGPNVLETNREQVLLAPEGIHLDIARLESGNILGTETQEALPVAGFLEGFEIPDAPEFTLWKDRKSASLLPYIKAALVKLIDRCRRTAATQQIEQYAEAMLGIDELSEEAIRAKMEARAFAGDRLTALRVYEGWRAKLNEAVGAQPSALIEGMAVRLRRRGWERSDTTIPTVPTDQWRGRLFVGRFDEYRVLYEGWEQTRRGKTSHALVLGDSGVGKTTLVNRLVTAAGLEGAAISRAQCYDLEREIPYAALGNLTSGLLDLPGVSATSPDVLAELGRYFACVRRRFPNIPRGEESKGETARLRLTEAFHQTLEAIVEDHPVILVIDDLHLCDEASMSVLHLLMHRVGGHPIMLVLVARAGELPRSPLAARFRTDAEALGLHELTMSPLSEAESNEVLNGLLEVGDVGVDSALRRAMVRVSGGFPMMLELLVQDWKSNGSQSLALALDSMTADFGSAGEAPELYHKVLDRMVFALDQGTRNVLNVAAILGHRLNDLSLYEIADLGPGQVMAGMAVLVQRRILRDTGRGLEFINEFVRTAAYVEVPSPVRRSLHACIAARLMAEEARGIQFLGLEIAWHAIRAGQTDCMATYVLKGADQAIGQGALDAAASALRTALPRLPPDNRLSAALLLAEVLQEQGRWQESVSVLNAECVVEPSGLSKVFSILASHRSDDPPASQLNSDVQYLESLVCSKAPLRVRLRAISTAAQLMGDARNPEVARSLGDLADRLRDDDLPEDDRMQLELCLAQLLYHSGQQERALSVLTSLLALFRSKGVVNSRLGRIHAGLGVIRCYQGDYEQALTEFQAGFSIAVRIGNDAQRSAHASHASLCLLRLGRYHEQLEWAEKTRRTLLTTFGRTQVTYYRAFALAMLGDSGSAMRALEALEPLIESECPLWFTQARRLLTSDILHLCGQTSAALAQAKIALALPEPVLHTLSFAGAFARWLALSVDGRASLSAAKCHLEELSRRMSQLDAIDRVEVTCARLILGDANKLELEGTLRSYLAGLPEAVVNQMCRLGVLRTAA
jgi:DNA-binding SARP family transcriptional activator/tetratricopeptide (TPR) repeat protein